MKNSNYPNITNSEREELKLIIRSVFFYSLLSGLVIGFLIGLIF